MLVKVKSSEQDANMDRHIVLECGHTSTITFEMLRGNAARKMPKAGSTFDCALCGPEPEKLEPTPRPMYDPALKANEGTTPNTKNATTDSKDLNTKIKELFGVDKMESKLVRIKDILEEE